MENMAIWTAVSSTDPKFTSRVQQRGGFTSIDAYFQIRQATELWGPYGFRWGLRNLRRTLEKDLEMAILDAEFFYPVENETVSFEIGNSLFFVLKSKSGDKPDDEFIKKLETNTISKALSRLVQKMMLCLKWASKKIREIFIFQKIGRLILKI